VSQARVGELERRMSNMVRPGTVLEADYAKARVKVQVGQNQTAWIPWMTGRAGEDRSWHAPEVGEQVIVLSPSGDLAAGYVMPGGVYKNDYPANADSAEIQRTTYKDGAVMEYDRENHAHLIQIPDGGKATVKVGADASTEILPDKITHRVTDDSTTVIEADTITHKVGDDAQTEITASKITHKFGGDAKAEITSGGVKLTVGGTVLNVLSGGVEITGKLTVSQDIETTGGDVKAQTITLKTHKHLGVQPGTGTTGLPTP
jgi:phage baseplate assembly protein V